MQIASGWMAGVAEVPQIAAGSTVRAAEASQIASGFTAGVPKHVTFGTRTWQSAANSVRIGGRGRGSLANSIRIGRRGRRSATNSVRIDSRGRKPGAPRALGTTERVSVGEHGYGSAKRKSAGTNQARRARSIRRNTPAAGTTGTALQHCRNWGRRSRLRQVLITSLTSLILRTRPCGPATFSGTLGRFFWFSDRTVEKHLT